MSSVPRMISKTVLSKETTYLCYFEIESETHTIRVVVKDNKIRETLRHGDHSHHSLSETQWIRIKAEIAEKLL